VGNTPAKDTLAPAALKIDKATEQEVFSDDAYKTTDSVDKSEKEGFWDWLIRKLFGDVSDRNVERFWNIFLLLLGVLFIAGIVFIVIKMNGGKIFRGESSKTSVFTDIGENIDSIDVDALVKEAIDKGDYRLAFRYSYLKSLQLMNNKELIDWKPYKTNYEYYIEFKKQSSKSLFRDLYTGFEYVWYGDAVLTRDTFEKYRTEFNNFNQQLGV
jgi:hypothetical protein